MIRSAVILIGGVLATTSIGCSPSGGPSGSLFPKVVPAVCQSQGITDGASFISTQKVQYLYGNPTPYLLYPNYTAPSGYGPVSSPYSDNLAAAFDNAPAAFQAAICNLKHVFINLNSCSGSACISEAWGYRETPAQYPRGSNPTLNTYVAIPKDLWFGNWSQSYHDYETTLLQTLLGWGGSNAPQLTSAIPDDLDTVVLAALAHEVGHVRWYEKFVSSPGSGVHDLKKFCNGTFFSGWQGGWGQVTTPPSWRDLQTPSTRKGAGYQKHQNSPQTIDIDKAISSGTYNGTNGAGDLLDKTYQNSAPWATFWGSITADEDFVETYKLFVLTRATKSLTSLNLSIPTNPSYQEDIPKNLGNKSDLSAKLSCFDADP